MGEHRIRVTERAGFPWGARKCEHGVVEERECEQCAAYEQFAVFFENGQDVLVVARDLREARAEAKRIYGQPFGAITACQLHHPQLILA